MNVVMIGAGYVGLVSGACFAEFGARVTCIDKDAAKISALSEGRIPIYEPGLDDLVERNATSGRLSFTTELAAAVADADLVVLPGSKLVARDLEWMRSVGLDQAVRAAVARGVRVQHSHQADRRSRRGELPGDLEDDQPAAAAPPATNPLAHAHWKLNPPMRPSTSSISPIRYNPRHTRDSMVPGSTSSSATPPAVTSA